MIYDGKLFMESLPVRIISLAPSITEILFALGLDEEIIGVTEFCDYPSQARLKEKVGGFLEVDVERIKALHPDLILAYGESQESLLRELEGEGKAVWVMNARTVDEVLESINEVGALVGRPSAAHNLTLSLTKRLDEVKRRVSTIPDKAKPRVLRILDYRSLIIAGPGSVQYDAIAIAGGKNIALSNSPAYPCITIETLKNYDPEVVITCELQLNEAVDMLKEYRKKTGIDNIRICSIPHGIVCRPGPRVVELVEMLSKSLGFRR